ncbi:HNH endonuclease [Desulforamulus ferrireducens]|uniref:HNH nuclease domain-containing protein n=1 Tax=Desulforamulus ferrireducens TaxID=1833852 RepID=A0A1S6IXD3_9FIRM|nr:HNH endonuclease [Desulforamulus ferrireducens]AQS59441.1 hypothetical protein B0537_10285 [Desulforamulus ferrireducens]
MENIVYKIYDLEDELDLFIIFNGIPKLLRERGSELSNRVIQLEKDDNKIDEQTKKDFIEDIGEHNNEIEEVFLSRIKRYQKIVKRLKIEYDHKCQLCGENFLMDNGNYYCEAHHIKMLSKDGSQSPENVLILCANHHRMFHYASKNCVIGDLIDGKRIIKIGEKEYTVQYKIIKI